MYDDTRDRIDRAVAIANPRASRLHFRFGVLSGAVVGGWRDLAADWLRRATAAFEDANLARFVTSGAARVEADKDLAAIQATLLQHAQWLAELERLFPDF